MSKAQELYGELENHRNEEAISCFITLVEFNSLFAMVQSLTGKQLFTETVFLFGHTIINEPEGLLLRVFEMGTKRAPFYRLKPTQHCIQ